MKLKLNYQQKISVWPEEIQISFFHSVLGLTDIIWVSLYDSIFQLEKLFCIFHNYELDCNPCVLLQRGICY